MAFRGHPKDCESRFRKEARRISGEMEKGHLECSSFLRNINENIDNYDLDDLEQILAELKKDKEAAEEMRKLADKSIAEIKDVEIKLHEKLLSKVSRHETGRKTTYRDSGYNSTDSRVLQERMSTCVQPSDALCELEDGPDSLSGPTALSERMIPSVGQEHDENDDSMC